MSNLKDQQIQELKRELSRFVQLSSRVCGDVVAPLFSVFATAHLETKMMAPLRRSTKNLFEQQVRSHLIPGFGHLPIDSITNSVWLAWVEAKRQEGRITRFFNARKCLLEILLAAKEAGHIAKMPRLDPVDEKRDCGRMLADREVLALIWRARRPFRFIFYTMWKMGCRPREILQWRWEHISWDSPSRAWISIPAAISKCDRARSIPLNSDVSKMLWIRRRKQGHVSPHVFPARADSRRPQLSYHSAWRTACGRAGIERAVAYDFRRTMISRCAADGAPMVYVAKLLDTSTKQIESTYAKMQRDVLEKIVK